MRFIEDSPALKGHVNFTDQSINRRLALEGSLTAKWDTLDMKDASDRVSMWLVDRLFEFLPELHAALYATRSGFTRLPDGEVVRLEKFAPMGSALCFPIESVVFYALAVSALMHEFGWTEQKARQSVYVYGDDIICRTKTHGAIRQFFDALKLRFNEQKCCTGSSFRESCGCDAYRGVDVTPTKIRAVWCDPGTPESIMSYCSYQNSFYLNGYWAASEFLRDHLKQVAPLPDKCGNTSPWTDEHTDMHLRWQKEGTDLPYVDLQGDKYLLTAYLGTMTSQVNPLDVLKGFKTRFNTWNCHHEVRSLVPSNRRKVIKTLSWCEMLRVHSQRSLFTKAGVYPSSHRVNLKWGWTPIIN
jgi:hypothetical protein